MMISLEGSHSGLVRPPAKRLGGVEPPHGFESHSLRHFTLTLFCYWNDQRLNAASSTRNEHTNEPLLHMDHRLPDE